MSKEDLKKEIESNKSEAKEHLNAVNLSASENLKRIWLAEKAATGITQKEKAASMGFSQAYFANFIAGRRTISLKALIRFAEAFNCNCSDIVPEIQDKY